MSSTLISALGPHEAMLKKSLAIFEKKSQPFLTKKSEMGFPFTCPWWGWHGRHRRRGRHWGRASPPREPAARAESGRRWTLRKLGRRRRRAARWSAASGSKCRRIRRTTFHHQSKNQLLQTDIGVCFDWGRSVDSTVVQCHWMFCAVILVIRTGLIVDTYVPVRAVHNKRSLLYNSSWINVFLCYAYFGHDRRLVVSTISRIQCRRTKVGALSFGRRKRDSLRAGKVRPAPLVAKKTKQNAVEARKPQIFATHHLQKHCGSSPLPYIVHR